MYLTNDNLDDNSDCSSLSTAFWQKFLSEYVQNEGKDKIKYLLPPFQTKLHGSWKRCNSSKNFLNRRHYFQVDLPRSLKHSSCVRGL